jgi:ankyrin repeat protein
VDMKAQRAAFGSALIGAARGGHTDVVQMLLENGAIVSTHEPTHQSTALFAAAACGDSEVVNMLLGMGADPNAEGGEYESPLEAAAHGRHEEVSRLLLQNGACRDPKKPSGPDTAESALHLAVQGDHDAVASLLLDWRSVNPSSKDDTGITSLMNAAYRGDDSIMQLLLDKGADIRAIALFGSTALMMAAEGGHEPAVHLLLTYGADLASTNQSERHL